MREKEDNGTEGQRDLFDVRQPNDVRDGVSNRGTEDEICLRDLPKGEDPGKTNPGKRVTRQAYIDGRIKEKKKKCDICGLAFVVGPTESWKGRCGECAPIMKESMITCPVCKNMFQLKSMRMASVVISSGKSGTKKYKIHYCRL